MRPKTIHITHHGKESTYTIFKGVAIPPKDTTYERKPRTNTFRYLLVNLAISECIQTSINKKNSIMSSIMLVRKKYPKYKYVSRSNSIKKIVRVWRVK
jgi:hypothetical protein